MLSEAKSKVSRGFQLSRSLTAFLICVGLATLFWMLKLLSANYVTVVEFPVRYEGFPTDKVPINFIPSTLGVKVNAMGYDLVLNSCFENPDTIVIHGKYLTPRSNKENQFFIATKELLTNATYSVDNSLEISQILLDTLRFTFDEKVSKVIPISLDISTSFSKQYQAKSELRIRPEAIQISGPKSVIDTMSSIRISAIELKEINESISFNVPIDFYDIRITAHQKNVIVAMEVEKFTEARIQVPITFFNQPKRLNLKTFPDKVEVTYTVGLSDFDRIAVNDFVASIDLNQLKNSPEKLNVKLNKRPVEVRITKVKPESVEYIIKK